MAVVAIIGGRDCDAILCLFESAIDGLVIGMSFSSFGIATTAIVANLITAF